MSTPQHSAALPERGKNFLRIVWARAGSTERAYSLSSAVVGRNMHWVDGRTELCVKPMMHCAWCHVRLPVRWYGWLYGVSITHQGPCLIQLTEQCVRDSLQLRDSACNLKGALVELSRAASPRNGAVTASIRLQALARGLPQDEPDVLKYLARFYRVEFDLEGRDDLAEGETS